jgi:hypothetical protein
LCKDDAAATPLRQSFLDEVRRAPVPRISHYRAKPAVSQQGFVPDHQLTIEPSGASCGDLFLQGQP